MGVNMYASSTNFGFSCCVGRIFTTVNHWNHYRSFTINAGDKYHKTDCVWLWSTVHHMVPLQLS